MIANRTQHQPTTKNVSEPAERQLWYVPDRRIRTKAALEQAMRVAQWIATGTGLPEPPGEEQLFVALHTCAFNACRRAITPREVAAWTARWKAIREHIVERNLGLVYSMLGRFSTRRADEDDLLSDAMLALTRAADRFNPWRGYRFSTYACNVIARALMRRGKRESNYRRLFPVQHDASFERADTSENESDSALYVERLRWVLDKNLGELTEMESQILSQRFPAVREARLTFQEIGKAVGLSKERVRQIQNVALDKLRDVLLGDPVLQ
jgi:RNA polymerase sigma factor (sigma-70 family)